MGMFLPHHGARKSVLVAPGKLGLSVSPLKLLLVPETNGLATDRTLMLGWFIGQGAVMALLLGPLFLQGLRNPPTKFQPFCRATAASRIAVRVVRDVMASGSVRNSNTATLPASRARSRAAAKSSLRSTISPWAPNDRA